MVVEVSLAVVSGAAAFAGRGGKRRRDDCAGHVGPVGAFAAVELAAAAERAAAVELVAVAEHAAGEWLVGEGAVAVAASELPRYSDPVSGAVAEAGLAADKLDQLIQETQDVGLVLGHEFLERACAVAARKQVHSGSRRYRISSVVLVQDVVAVGMEYSPVQNSVS